jgi:hypothetical protein
MMAPALGFSMKVDLKLLAAAMVRSEDRGQKTEIRDQRSEDRGRILMVSQEIVLFSSQLSSHDRDSDEPIILTSAFCLLFSFF